MGFPARLTAVCLAIRLPRNRDRGHEALGAAQPPSTNEQLISNADVSAKELQPLRIPIHLSETNDATIVIRGSPRIGASSRRHVVGCQGIEP